MRVKDIVVLRNEKTTDTSRRYIGLENITSWDARFVETTSETEGTNNIFYPNDILFGKLRPYLAKGYIPKYEGICSTEFFVMSCKSGVLPHYLLYVFLSHSVIDFIKNQVAGVKMPRTNWDEFGNLNIDLPSLSVQQKMVDYLDEKTSAIDTKVELLEKKKDAYTRLKKAMINRAVTRGLDEHVKLKDSGVEWIGMIPEHWMTMRFKDICILVSGNGFKVEYQGEETGKYPFMKVSDLTGNTKIVYSASNFVSDYLVESESYNVIPAYSILFPKIGESLKKNHRKINAKPCCIDNNCSALVRKNARLDMNYLYYVMKCIDLRWFDYNGTVPCINTKMFMSSCTSFPPLFEQQAISSYLDEKCAKIDAAIANIDKQTDALKRLKRSLINEVITGHRAV